MAVDFFRKPESFAELILQTSDAGRHWYWMVAGKVSLPPQLILCCFLQFVFAFYFEKLSDKINLLQ